jgi:hypothetical protein
MRVTLMVVALLGLSGVCFAQQVRGDLIQGLKADKPSYELGSKIRFEYAVRNDSNQAIVYSFPTAKQFDIWVMCDGKECFRLSKRMFYAQMLTSLALRPGEIKTYCGEWDQKDASGKQIGPGTYTVYAQLTPSGKPPPRVTGRVQIGTRGATLIPVSIKEAISNYTAFVGKRALIAAVYKGSRPNPNDPNTRDGPPGHPERLGDMRQDRLHVCFRIGRSRSHQGQRRGNHCHR